MLAILLAIGSSLAYGVSDFLGGRKSRSLALLTVLVISQGTGLILLSAIVIARADGVPHGSFLLYAALAGLSETIGVAALYRGLAVGTMSIVAPAAATAPVVAVLVGVVLGEMPTPIQGLGIALAVAGIILASCGRSADATSGVAISILFGLLTALGWGGYLVAMDAASEGGVPWALLIARLTTVTVFLIAFLITRPPVSLHGADLLVIAAIGVVIVGADSMYALATTQGVLSVIAVLSSLYPVVTIALARVYLHEHLRPLQQIGVAASLCGVATIVAS